MVDVLGFLIQYKAIILFYLAVIIFLIVKRKQIETQLKFIFLYRTKFGLRWMDHYSKKHREWVILLGYIGTGIGFVGMGFIIVALIKNLYDLLTNPAAVGGASLALPGVNIPGFGVLPFWHWLVAIFLIAVIHEFSHGIVARAYNIPVKNTGLAFFGPVLGAFVEPDEQKMAKEKDIVQYSVLAAGAFSNILMAVIAFFLVTAVTQPLLNSMTEPSGFTFDMYVNESLPFAQAGILPGTIITSANGKPVTRFEDLGSQLQCMQPGQVLSIGTTQKNYNLTLAQNPSDATKPYLGIMQIHNDATLKPEFTTPLWKFTHSILDVITDFLRWLFLLSSGIGLFNLLPLPIVDGGRMLQIFLRKRYGDEIGERRYRRISTFLLLLLIAIMVLPFVL
ncbi:site-2 protease family protein [Candidatus Woesearchaeota archaeon]|nr:site-2 protease family protein [Candidatus Woesearchaeota archaeon]